MVRLMLNLVSQLIAAALALLISSWILPDNVTLHLAGFVVAVLVFSLAQAILGPFVFNLARKYASAVLGGIGLVSTLVALWVATLFPDGLNISGIGWILAPLIVWLVTALGSWILMGFVFKKTIANRAKAKNAS